MARIVPFVLAAVAKPVQPGACALTTSRAQRGACVLATSGCVFFLCFFLFFGSVLRRLQERMARIVPFVLAAVAKPVQPGACALTTSRAQRGACVLATSGCVFFLCFFLFFGSVLRRLQERMARIVPFVLAAVAKPVQPGACALTTSCAERGACVLATSGVFFLG